MSLNTFVKTIQNIMRSDAGINGDAQRIEQMTWLLFLKIYGNKEENWAIIDENYQSIIPPAYQWQNWATDHKDGNTLTGDDLLHFIDAELMSALKNLRINEQTPRRQRIVRDVFLDAKNFMKDGVQLRKVINEIDAIDFDSSKERHTFGEIYETILKSLQSAGNAGEFYTPRAVTDFMVQMIAPVLGETVADFACGTGGFLVSALNHLEPQVKTINDRTTLNASLYGVEKKPLPHLLAITNLILHDIDSPNIRHGNALEQNVRDYREADRHDIILMNPPYGGSEQELIKQNFPAELRSSETADLFIALAMATTAPKAPSKPACSKTTTCTPSSACRKASLRPTPASPPISSTSTNPPQAKRRASSSGTTAWTSLLTAKPFPKPNRCNLNTSPTASPGGTTAPKSQTNKKAATKPAPTTKPNYWQAAQTSTSAATPTKKPKS